MSMTDPNLYEGIQTKLSVDWTEHIPKILESMNWTSSTKSNSRVLDYGCGHGVSALKYFVPIAESTNSHLIGIDISNDMLEFAKKESAHDRISYYQGNIMNDADYYHANHEIGLFKHGSYDVIFCNLVLQWIQDYATCFARFHELLSHDGGGQLGFNCIGKSTGIRLLYAAGNHAKWSKYMKGYKELTPSWFTDGTDCEEVFRSCLSSIGFKIIRLETVKKSIHGKSEELELLIDLYISINPLVAQIPLDELKEFRDFYGEQIMADGNRGEYEFVVGVVEKIKK